MSNETSGSVVRRGGGEKLRYPRGGTLEWKARGEDTSDAYALLEFMIPPGGTGSPLHYHVATEESFYLVEGTLTFTLGSRVMRLGSGDFVIVPRMVTHTFTNSGSSPARLLITLSPASFEVYFVELAALMVAGDVDPGALAAVAERHGQVFVDAR